MNFKRMVMGRKLFLFPVILLLLCSLLFWNCLPAELFDVPFSTIILDRDGKLLGASIAQDGQWRFPPTLEVPEKFVHAIMCYEDRRFFRHPGVDPFAIARALWSNIRSGRIVSGASTLTMQVIRLSRRGRPRILWEKLVEMVLAIRLELSLSKKEILALYSSHAPFGGNVVGLQAAAWRYFGRSPDQLSWAETATLAVLPNNPALIHPGKNREGLRMKRDRLLDKLRENDILDSLSRDLAKKEPLPPRPHPIPMLAPHLLWRIQKSETWPRHTNKGLTGVFHHSSRVQTTLKREIQILATEIIQRHHRQLAQNGIHNAAALILEVESGEVLAYVGNVPDFSSADHGNHVDIITAPRSPGSVLKPLLYAGMLSAGELLPSQLVPDVPTRWGGFAPQNYSRTYEGAVPAYRALARSLNVPAVRLLQSYGVDRFHTLLKQLGMTTLHRSADEYGLSLMLGGAEGTLWDITAIYAGIARSVGRHFGRMDTDLPVSPQPHYLLSHEIANDAGSGSHGLAGSFADRVIDPGASWLTLEAMVEVMRPGEESAWRDFSSSRKIAWKTGTSYGFRDGWAVGVTPRFAVGVWVGNADGEGRPGLTGIATAAPILFELFGSLDFEGWFDRPESDLVQIQVCAKSGYRAGPNCVETRRAWIPHTGLRTEPCPYCKVVHYDSTLTWRVHSECERVASMKAMKQFILPPAIEWYYKRTHSDYEPLPEYRNDCIESIVQPKASSMTLISPGKSGRIYIPVELDGHRGRAIFEAAHRDTRKAIYWHLDQEYLGETREIHQMALAPKPGKHTLTLVDENGEILQRSFTVLSK